MRIEHSVVTDTGKIRTENQDSYGIVPEAGFFAVLDGMGGAAAGDFASKAAAQVMIAAMSRLKREEIDGIVKAELPEKVKRACAAIRLANRSLFHMVTKYPRLSGMGTTVVAVVIDDEAGMAHILHVGDSRLYRIRCGGLKLLTNDHSKINELIAQGKMKEEDARTAEIQSMITRALGTSPVVKIDCLSVPIMENDGFVLCTDGLNGELEDAEITRVAVAQNGRPGAVARELVNAANAAGGRDNTTVLSLHFTATGQDDPSIEDPVRPLTLDDEIPAETMREDVLVKTFLAFGGIKIPRMARERNLFMNPLTIGTAMAFLAAAAVLIPARYGRQQGVALNDLAGNVTGVSLDIRAPSPEQLSVFSRAEDSIQRLQTLQDWKIDKRNNTVPLENVQVLVEENGKDQFLFKGLSGAQPLEVKLKHGNYTIHLKYPGYRIISDEPENTNDIPMNVEPGTELKPLVVIMIPAEKTPEKGGDRVGHSAKDPNN